MKSPRPEPSDEELMLAYRDGNEEAFVLLFKRYNVRIFNYLLRHIGDRAKADDLLQDTFLKLHRRRKSYEPLAAFSTYIFTIASNLLRDAKVSATRHANVIELEGVSEKIAMGAGSSEPVHIQTRKSTEDEYVEREIGHYLRQAIHSLPSEQREVILLAKYEGFKYEEIAEILNITVSAAKVRVHRAMIALEKILKSRFDNSLL